VKTNTKELLVKLIKTSDLFIDEVSQEIHFGNVRLPHPKGSAGYQRDPYDRAPFIKETVENFDIAQLLPLDVSLRPDGRLAIIDGGGRWAVAQKLGMSYVQCRIHTGMTIEDEADLFEKLAKCRRPITNVNTYLADLRAGKGDTVAINNAIKPYKVAKGKGAGTLDGVGPLYDIYVARGEALLKKTAQVLTNTAWGRYKDGVFKGSHLKSNQFGAVALVLDTFPKIENDLRKVLDRKDYTPAEVVIKAQAKLLGTKARTTERLVVMAEVLAMRADSSLKDDTDELRKLRNSSLMTALHRQRGIQVIKKKLKESDDETAEVVTKKAITKKVAKMARSSVFA
jgi:hypothetical protein